MFESKKIEDISIGMTEAYTQTITDADVKNFAGISGDRNPIHMSDEYASDTRYGRRIAHGLISVSFFSSLFGNKLPGPGCVYASQSIKFKRAVYIGDTVVARVTVKSLDIKMKKVIFDTICTVNGKVVINGEAEIFIPGTRK